MKNYHFYALVYLNLCPDLSCCYSHNILTVVLHIPPARLLMFVSKFLRILKQALFNSVAILFSI